MKKLSNTYKWVLPVAVAAVVSTLTAGSAKAEELAVPDREAANTLVRNSMLSFDHAIKNGDFETLFSELSELWQNQTSPEAIRAIMETLINEKPDFSGVAEVDAVFSSPPKLSDSGWVELSGFFPTQPRKSVFDLTYLPQAGEWKLAGFNIRTAAYPLPLPEIEVIEKMAETTLLSFANAINTESFEEFHKEISIPFRRQFTAEQFLQSFYEFVENKIDLSFIEGLKPVFDKAPEIDDNDMMALKGHYRLETEKIDFDLIYTPEKSEWKLMEISVYITPDETREEQVPELPPSFSTQETPATDAVVLEDLSPIADMVQFLRAKVEIADETERVEFESQLAGLLALENLLLEMK